MKFLEYEKGSEKTSVLFEKIWEFPKAGSWCKHLPKSLKPLFFERLFFNPLQVNFINLSHRTFGKLPNPGTRIKNTILH
jgi:hypothetical protein